MKNCLIILLILVLLQSFHFSFGQGKSQSPFYHLKVRIDPESGILDCITEIQNPLDSSFILNKDMEIHNIAADGRIVSFNKKESNDLPNSAEFIIDSKVQKELVIEYSGKINGESFQPIIRNVNMIKPNLIELAIYVAWYPRLKNHTSFDFELDVDLPSNFITVANGSLKEEKVEGNHRLTKWESYEASSDILLLAAPGLKKSTLNSNGTIVEIYYDKLPESYIDSMKSNLIKSVNWLTKLLGQPKSKGLIRVGYSPRPAWGYVRTPFIIVSEEKAVLGRQKNFGPQRDFRYITHEIAHYWWNTANTSTPDDWINEGLAEYSAFLVSEDIVGMEFAKQLLKEYNERAKNSMTETPIAETENNSVDREVNRYAKPVLIFNDARDKFGNENMNRLYSSLYNRFMESRNATTGIFLDEVEKQIGEKAKEFFSEALYEKKWNSNIQIPYNSYSEVDSMFLGTWSGILTQMGMKMRVVLHINKKEGNLKGVMDSPDQGVKDIPVSEIKIDGDLFTFKLGAAAASFSGHLDRTILTITGKWNQSGTDFPLSLTKE